MSLCLGHIFSRSRSPLTPERRESLRRLQETLGVKFRDPTALDQALSHRSLFSSKEDHCGVRHNERMEFLGDAVLGAVAAACLYRALPDSHEGDLAKTKAVLVSTDTLSDIALSLRIDHYLLLGKGEELSGVRHKKAILADATEAVIGALFLDSGFKAAERFVLRLLLPRVRPIREKNLHHDYKSTLQVLAHQRYRSKPEYTVVKRTGPDHSVRFWVDVTVGDARFGPGYGTSKKSAEQCAARLAWEQLSGTLRE